MSFDTFIYIVVVAVFVIRGILKVKPQDNKGAGMPPYTPPKAPAELQRRQQQAQLGKPSQPRNTWGGALKEFIETLEKLEKGESPMGQPNTAAPRVERAKPKPAQKTTTVMSKNKGATYKSSTKTQSRKLVAQATAPQEPVAQSQADSKWKSLSSIMQEKNMQPKRAPAKHITSTLTRITPATKAKKEAMTPERAPTATGWKLFFDINDMQRAIVMSEILKAPKAIQKGQNH